MTKLSQAFNLNDSIRVKTFELNNHTFKVKVPLDKELDAITEKYINLSKEEINIRLEKMTQALTSENIEGVEVKDDDVFVDGKSTKETVVSILQMEKKITEYFKLLIAEAGDLSTLTYEEIADEFPLQIQFELLSKISEVIQPGYKDARKN